MTFMTTNIFPYSYNFSLFPFHFSLKIRNFAVYYRKYARNIRDMIKEYHMEEESSQQLAEPVADLTYSPKSTNRIGTQKSLKRSTPMNRLHTVEEFIVKLEQAVLARL